MPDIHLYSSTFSFYKRSADKNWAEIQIQTQGNINDVISFRKITLSHYIILNETSQVYNISKI